MTPGPKENFGCLAAAPADHDKDGVPDNAVRCPNEPGSKDNDGCPDVDSDGDGIVDRSDQCPFDAEVFNGVDDEDGCPDQPAALADIADDKITTREKIQFVGNAIDARSAKVLKAVAGLLKAHNEILKLRVEGHTDNRGSAIDNLDLSRARAAAVRRFLIENGIEPSRLSAQGYGPDRPVADNKDAAGRTKNNRIELMIVGKRK
jgi:outer membrane protein OmpA-like peptidoglycan-associated protein